MQKDKMSFFEHLEALRWVLLKCLIVFGLGCGVMGVFLPDFAEILAWPLMRIAGENSDSLQGLVTRSPMGVFSVLIQICSLGGLALALPFMAYFIVSFVVPALSPKEKRLLIPACSLAFLLFLAGGLFAYFFLLPASLMISMKLNHLLGFELIWSAASYYGLVVWMTIGVGLGCEFPLLLFLLLYLGVLSVEKLKAARRMVFVIVLLVSAIITPTGDPFTLAMLAAPMYLLYEISIAVGARFEKRAKQKEENFAQKR